jgi:hypothetical protein
VEIRGAFQRAAREHGGVIVVVAVTVLGVLVATSISDADTVSSAPTRGPVPTTTAAPPATAGATGDTLAPPVADGVVAPFVGTVSGGSGPAGGVSGAAPSAQAAPSARPGAASQAPPAALLPNSALAPLGDLSSIDAAIRSLCSTLLLPFGLPATVFGLVGGTIPFTLPELPFSIVVGPLSDLCLSLEEVTP